MPETTLEKAQDARPTDEQLLSEHLAGKRDAFGTLVRRYEREMYGYLRRYLGDGDLAHDVFQNTFLQVFTKVGTNYEEGRSVRPWLYTIATHQAIDALRRKSRHQLVSLDQSREELPNGEIRSLLELLESRDPGPATQIESDERREYVRTCIEKLPEFLRQVVVMAYYQGMKYREMAEALGVPVGTVKSRLHAALGKLEMLFRSSEALVHA